MRVYNFAIQDDEYKEWKNSSRLMKQNALLLLFKFIGTMRQIYGKTDETQATVSI